MNCGGFIIDFEDELNNTGTGFDDPVSGATRRGTICQVFIDLAAVIDLGSSTPDLLIREAEFDGQGPLASASPRIPGNAMGCIGGSLHEHITTGNDPTPAAGVYDAEIRQVDFGARMIGGTPVNVNDDWTIVPLNDLDLYSVILHETTHALGFFSLIGPTGASNLTSGAYSLFDEFLVDNGTNSFKLINAQCAFQATAADLTTSQVLYNTPATHNSQPQPVYSPQPFGAGSSLSHFDEVRGQLPYVMRSQTSGGADRLLLQPELDVLCDLGYTLFGTTCTNQWPIGVDDTNLAQNVTNPGSQICINVLGNDSDPDFDPLSIAPGSVLVANGGGTAFASGSDICYTPSFGFCGTAVIEYQPFDGQREGNVTELWVDVDCQVCPNDACNLVCNGGFEDGIAAIPQLGFQTFSPLTTVWPQPPCASPTTGWCGQRKTADYYIRGTAQANWSIPTNFFSNAPSNPSGMVDTHNGAPNDRYIGMMRTTVNNNYEGVFTETIQPLDGSGATSYSFGFWAYAIENCFNCTPIDGELEVYLDDVPPIATGNPFSPTPSNPSANALQLGNFTIPRNQWTYLTVPSFTPSFNYEFLVIRAADQAPAGSNTYIYVDDVELRELSAVNVDILKWVNDPTPQLGQPITYTIAVCNLDPGPITNVTIQDVLPNGLTHAGGLQPYPQYTFPSIAGQTCSTVNVQAIVDLSAPVNTPITNCAFLASAGNMCTSLNSNSQCVDIVVEATDLGVTKTVSNSSPNPGSTVIYMITATNFGGIDATGVVVNDLLPAGVAYQSHSAGGGATYNNVTGDLTIPSLPAGSSVTLDIVAVVGASGCGVVNTATLTALDQSDLDLTNNQDSVAFTPCISTGGGSGIFVDSGQNLGNAASITVDLGDIDGDGDLDAVVGNFRQPARVWLNNGGGIFSGGQSLAAAWEDVAVRLGHFNGGSDLDLFIADNTGPATVWFGNGSGVNTFGAAPVQSLGGSNSLDAELGDVDNDGDLDAIVANNGGNTVWLNSGGAFTLGQSLGSLASWGMALGHLDNDAWPDAVFANAGTGTNGVGDRVWWHQGSASFVDSGQSLGSQASRKVVLGDLDGDGDLDAVVRTVPGQPNGAWENLGVGTASFAAVGQTLGFAGNAVDLGDVDADGLDDAFFAHPGGNRVLLNDGLGNLTFTDSGQSLGSSNSRDVKLGDLDGDGDLDAFIVNYNQPNKVWINEGSVFCISGTATGAGYTWQLLGNGINLVQPNAPGVTAGGSAADLAAAFVASINALGGQSVNATVTPGNSSCFSVSATGSPSLQLFVGQAGGLPTCQVTAGGCTYNPTIRAGFPKPEPTPSLEIVSPNIFGTVAGRQVTLSWWAQNVGEEAWVDLYYDLDADGEGGKLIAEGLPAGEGSFTWEPRGVAAGKVFIYGIVTDADRRTATGVSDGTVTILNKLGEAP
ncbi:MAG: FG-GAP-like repeat-containing protein [Acidobacteriota bacterium]